MTSIVRRFVTGFGFRDTSVAGLEQHEDGSVWVVMPDGSEVQLGEPNGGSTPGTAIWKGPYAIPYDAPVGVQGYAIADLFQPAVGDWLLGVTYDPVLPFDESSGTLYVGHYDDATDVAVDFADTLLGGLTPATDRSGAAAAISNGNSFVGHVANQVQWLDGAVPLRAHWTNVGDTEGLINVYLLVASGELP